MTEQEINEICSSLRVGTATGFDNIPIFIIKESIYLISSLLTHIFNLSITSGTVPTKLKTARVIPIFKTDVKYMFSNYRPISVLPSFSKILEKVVFNRLKSYVP